MEFKATFPKFKEIYPTPESLNGARKAWLATLIEQQVTTLELMSFGLARVREVGYARPISAGQFCKWCWEVASEKAGIAGREDTADFFMSAIRRNRPTSDFTGAMYQVYKNLDWYLLKRSESETYIREAIYRAHGKMIERFKTGQPFDKRAAVKEESLPVLPAERSVSINNIKKIKESLKNGQHIAQ